MADTPVKDVFEDEDDTGVEDDQRVIDEAEEAEEKAGAETAATAATTDDIEVVLAEEEKAETDADKEDGEEVEATDLAAVPGTEEAEGEEVDADLKTYSKKVQDRIARERRLVKRAREEADAAIGKERSQRIEAERRSLTAHKNLTDVLLVNIDGQIKAKSGELKALMTAAATGDEDATGKQVDVQGELDDLRAKKREIEGAKVSLASQAEEFERQVKAAPVVTTPTVSPATQSWLGQNKWFGRKGFFAETVAVRQLDSQLAAERGDKGSSEYFKELNRRIQAEIPDLGGKVRRAFKPVNQVRSAVAPVSRGSSASSDSLGKRRVTLDKADLQNMRDFKIDTSDPKAVALYAREKLAASKGAQ